MIINRSTLVRYGLAVLTVAAAVGLRASLNPVLHDRFLFGLAFCAVIAASWFGGRGPGLLSIVLSALASWYFVLPPPFTLLNKTNVSMVQLAVFVFISSLFAILSGSLRKANDTLQDREAQLRFIAAATPEILFTADASGQIEILSQRFFELAGKDRVQLGPMGWLNLIHADEKEAVTNAWSSSIAQQTEFHATCRFLTKEQNARWFQCRAVPMLDKQHRVIRWVGVCSDINDHKLLEEALARQTEALTRSNEDLQRFAFAASHDLQEPLKMVTLFSDLLIRNQTQNNESAYLVAQITRGVQRMQELIQSTLEFSRIRVEDMEQLNAMSLQDSLSEALWSLQAAINESAAKIVCGPLPNVAGDARMISRVFQNLLQNAIKFRRKDQPLVINISARSDNQTCVVSVSDNGIGLSMDYAASVFEPFRRLHPKGGFPGSGLGLTSVKKIIELHQGHVWLESVPGQGSTFFFTLPLAQQSQSPPNPVSDSKSAIA